MRHFGKLQDRTIGLEVMLQRVAENLRGRLVIAVAHSIPTLSATSDALSNNSEDMYSDYDG